MNKPESLVQSFDPLTEKLKTEQSDNLEKLINWKNLVFSRVSQFS